MNRIQNRTKMTTAVCTGLNPPTAFVVETESGTNAVRWPIWLRRFNQFKTATRLVSDSVIVAIFLTAAGEAIEEIYDALGKPETDKFDDVTKVISDHFRPLKDTEAEIVKFRHLQQRLGETIDAFVIRLRTAAKGCEFGQQAELEIKLQIIMTATSTRVRQKGKAESVTLADLCKFARAIELEAQSSKATYADFKTESIEVKKENLNHMSSRASNASASNWRTKSSAKPETQNV